MLKRSWLLCGLVLLVISASSCIFDPKEENKPIDPPQPAVKLEDQSQKWHVLNNIEYAYANRNSGSDVYNGLIDENFTFFFSPGDIGSGLPEQWGRQDEVDTTTGLFESNSGTSSGPECRSMRLDLQYNPETMTWGEVIPEGFPDEVWYQANIFYTFTFEMVPDQTLIAVPGAKAQFTVRDVDPTEGEHWMLVEFRDLGGN
jgi:hypothetical protein